ncbi:hypothetical protein GDO86_014421, partial [Hymenochirus boettgeri]
MFENYNFQNSLATEYKLISPVTWPNHSLSSDRVAVQRFLEDCKLNHDAAYGKTKVFIRTPRTLFTLEEKRSEMLIRIILFLQKLWRGTLARRKYKRMRAARRILGCYRRYKVKSYLRNVIHRFSGVKNSRDFGKQIKWPKPPKVLRHFQEALQRIFNRWRAFQLIKSLPPSEIPKVKAKVAAFENLKGHRSDMGLQRCWEGSYIESKKESAQNSGFFVSRSDELQRKDKFMKALFSCHVRKVNRFNKVEDRAIFITDRHLYKMDPGKQYKVMTSTPLYNVSNRDAGH